MTTGGPYHTQLVSRLYTGKKDVSGAAVGGFGEARRGVGEKRAVGQRREGLDPPPLTSMRRSFYAAFIALIFTLSISGCHSREATTCTSVNPAALSFPR